MSTLLGANYIKVFFRVIALCKVGHRKHDISKTVTARIFKLRQLIEDNEYITWWNLKKKKFASNCPLHFFELMPLHICVISKFKVGF